MLTKVLDIIEYLRKARDRGKGKGFGKAGLLGATAASLAFAGAGCGSGGAAAPGVVTVHLGYFPNLTHAPALVGVAQGIFARDLGTDKLDASQTFSAGPAENQALLSRSLDIAFEGPTSALSAYTNSAGAVRIIAGAASGGAGLVTRAAITDASRLKGTTIASPQLANTQDIALRYWLNQQGFTTTASGGGDVSVQPSSTGNGTIVTEFKAGSIDGAWVPEPYKSQLVASGGHVLVDEATLWPGGDWATTSVVVRTAFLQHHPATVKRFLKGLVDTLAFIDANPVVAQNSFNQQVATLQGGKSFSDSLLAKAWGGLKFTADPLASTFRTQVEHGAAVGLLKEPSDLAGIFNLDPLNSVLKSTGQQQVQGL